MTEVQSKRSKAILNVYLVLRDEHGILLSLRKNTGYFDHFYGFVAGHVEENESAMHAVIRETREEIGIEITPECLTLKSMMHRKTDRNNVDLFFECSQWKGEIDNKEPAKCERIEFFDLNSLPENTIPYIRNALKNIVSNNLYFEEGW